MKSFWKNIQSVYKHTLLVSSALVLVATATFSVGLQTKNATPATAVSGQVAHYADRVVARGYLTVLGRGADRGGRNYWYIRTTQNPNADWLAQALMNSAEYKKGSLAKVNNTDFINAMYKRAMGRPANQAELTWWTAALKNGSANRAKIAGFVIEKGFTYDLTRPVLEKDCVYTKGGSVHPICKGNTAGGIQDGVIVNVPESNIYVNKAWVQNISNLRFAAAQSRFYLEAYNDPAVVKALRNVPGSNLSPGSYRTRSDQTYLYNLYGYPRAARPGTSMHEWGLAIDLQCNGVPLSRNAACLNWMRHNAPRYGVYNLPSESWHWSSNGR